MKTKTLDQKMQIFGTLCNYALFHAELAGHQSPSVAGSVGIFISIHGTLEQKCFMVTTIFS